MKTKQWYLFFLLALAIGCASIVPIYTSTSEFDGAVEVNMSPVPMGGLFSRTNGLGLYKNSQMQKEMVVLTAMVAGVHTFATDKSLHFDIDGETVSFKPIEELTNIERYIGYFNNVSSSKSTSSKRYLIDRSFLQKIVSADRVTVKINLDNTHVEYRFTGSLAHQAFIEFDEKIESIFN